MNSVQIIIQLSESCEKCKMLQNITKRMENNKIKELQQITDEYEFEKELCHQDPERFLRKRKIKYMKCNRIIEPDVCRMQFVQDARRSTFLGCSNLNPELNRPSSTKIIRRWNNWDDSDSDDDDDDDDDDGDGNDGDGNNGNEDDKKNGKDGHAFQTFTCTKVKKDGQVCGAEVKLCRGKKHIRSFVGDRYCNSYLDTRPIRCKKHKYSKKQDEMYISQVKVEKMIQEEDECRDELKKMEEEYQKKLSMVEKEYQVCAEANQLKQSQELELQKELMSRLPPEMIAQFVEFQKKNKY